MNDTQLTEAPVRFSMVANVVNVSHLGILRDWVDFFDWPPDEIVAIIGRAEGIEPALQAFCDDLGIRLAIAGMADPKDLAHHEGKYIRVALEKVQNKLFAIVRLDTIPYRTAGKQWFKSALQQMEATGAFFVTGSTRLYETDQPTGDPDFFLTQRVSNNFLITAPAEWLGIQDARAGLVAKYGRFIAEGAVEAHCAETGTFGIRIRNTQDLRIFHTQEWGPRMQQVRQNMHDGVRIQPFLEGWEEDFHTPWDRYYGFPRPPWIKLMTRKIRNSLAIRTRLRRATAGQPKT